MAQRVVAHRSKLQAYTQAKGVGLVEFAIAWVLNNQRRDVCHCRAAHRGPMGQLHQGAQREHHCRGRGVHRLPCDTRTCIHARFQRCAAFRDRPLYLIPIDWKPASSAANEVRKRGWTSRSQSRLMAVPARAIPCRMPRRDCLPDLYQSLTRPQWVSSVPLDPITDQLKKIKHAQD